MFTREIADLASLWFGGITWRLLASQEGVEMAQSTGAIAGGVDRHDVNVVD
jgi:hypothetical protein